MNPPSLSRKAAISVLLGSDTPEDVEMSTPRLRKQVHLGVYNSAPGNLESSVAGSIELRAF